MSNTYDVFAVGSDISVKHLNSIRNLCKCDKYTVVCPIEDTSISNYFFIKSDKVPQVLSKLREITYIPNSVGTISKSELDTLIESVIDNAHSFEVGDEVKVRGYGDAPFVIKSIDGDFVEVTLKLRNIEYDKVFKMNQIKRFPDSHKYLWNVSLNASTDNVLVIDYTYTLNLIECETIDDILKFLIRIKSQFPRHRIAVCNYTKGVNKKFDDVIYHMDLPTVDNIGKGNVLFSGSIFYIRYFNTIVSLDQGRFKYYDRKSVDIDKTEIFYFILYLKEIGIITENVSFKETFNYIMSRPIDQIEVRFKKYWKYINQVKNINEDIEECYFTDFNSDKFKTYLIDNDVVWFVENYDYYLKIIIE